MALALHRAGRRLVLAGYIGIPHALGGHNALATWLEPAFGIREAAGGEACRCASTRALELDCLMGVSALIALVGIGSRHSSGWQRRELADSMARTFAPIHRLLLNKYYVDEIYDASIVQPIKVVSRAGAVARLRRAHHRRRRQRHGRARRRAVRRSCGACRPALSAPTRARSSPASCSSSATTYGVDAMATSLTPTAVLLLTLSWVVPLAGAILLLLIPNATAVATRWSAGWRSSSRSPRSR